MSSFWLFFYCSLTARITNFSLALRGEGARRAGEGLLFHLSANLLIETPFTVLGVCGRGEWTGVVVNLLEDADEVLVVFIGKVEDVVNLLLVNR